jgi:hypothetical protein
MTNNYPHSSHAAFLERTLAQRATINRIYDEHGTAPIRMITSGPNTRRIADRHGIRVQVNENIIRVRCDEWDYIIAADGTILAEYPVT